MNPTYLNVAIERSYTHRAFQKDTVVESMQDGMFLIHRYDTETKTFTQCDTPLHFDELLQELHKLDYPAEWITWEEELTHIDKLPTNGLDLGNPNVIFEIAKKLKLLNKLNALRFDDDLPKTVCAISQREFHECMNFFLEHDILLTEKNRVYEATIMQQL